MRPGAAGYPLCMPGDDDGLTPDAAPTGGSDEHTRIADKERFSGKPEVEGAPEEEGVDEADVDDRLEDSTGD
jgi:hypothetical protein